MAALPTLPTFTDGPSSSSQMTQLRDAINFTMRPPVAMLRQTSAQTLSTGTSTAIQFNAEDVDDDVDGVGGHDNVTNNTRYTARYPGIYLVSGGVTFAANATGFRLLWFRVNGIDINGSLVELNAVTGGAVAGMATRTIEQYLASGDYVELIAHQTSGGNLNTSVGTFEQPHMALAWKSRGST